MHSFTTSKTSLMKWVSAPSSESGTGKQDCSIWHPTCGSGDGRNGLKGFYLEMFSLFLNGFSTATCVTNMVYQQAISSSVGERFCAHLNSGRDSAFCSSQQVSKKKKVSEEWGQFPSLTKCPQRWLWAKPESSSTWKIRYKSGFKKKKLKN